MFRGDANFKENYVDLRGYKWKLDQLFVHEIIHCLQQNHTGFWNSNPVGGHAQWKWEGFAEYSARQKDHPELRKNIELYLNSDPSLWEIEFENGLMAPRNYYLFGILVQFQVEENRMSFKDILAADLSVEEAEKEMMNWYEATN